MDKRKFTPLRRAFIFHFLIYFKSLIRDYFSYSFRLYTITYYFVINPENSKLSRCHSLVQRTSYSREFREATLIFTMCCVLLPSFMSAVSENLFECGSLYVGVQKINYRQMIRPIWRIEAMALQEQSQIKTTAKTTRKTVNRLARKQPHLNHVVPERTKGLQT